MKSVLRSIKPYWFYLICEGKKAIEVSKTAPTAKDWDKITYLYCSKDMKSFNSIPKEHRERYRKYLGKVGARFVCDKVIKTCGWRLRGNTGWCAKRTEAEEKFPTLACLTIDEIVEYAGGEGHEVSGWHISDLKIYDKPKELGEFYTICNKYGDDSCGDCPYLAVEQCSFPCDDCVDTWCSVDNIKPITRPPQSWCYVESEV